MPSVKSLKVISFTPYLYKSIVYLGMLSFKNLVRLRLLLLSNYNRCIILLDLRIISKRVFRRYLGANKLLK
jgi:hypothetical protein